MALEEKLSNGLEELNKRYDQPEEYGTFHFRKLILETLCDYLFNGNDVKILETFTWGKIPLSENLKNSYYVGIDNSVDCRFHGSPLQGVFKVHNSGKSIKEIKSEYTIYEPIVADAYELPLREKCFEVNLVFLGYTAASLSEMIRTLKDDGFFIAIHEPWSDRGKETFGLPIKEIKIPEIFKNHDKLKYQIHVYEKTKKSLKHMNTTSKKGCKIFRLPLKEYKTELRSNTKIEKNTKFQKFLRKIRKK